ncbi:integrase core domain-containing protein [Pontibacter sp. XAAS-A31]|nr:integrase core domain-containing protein [Pontibacter harenae]
MLYLTVVLVVLDLADRKVVSWALSETLDAEATIVAAWQMAVRNRPLFRSLLFNSDRGVQYACSEFREQLEGTLVLQSMSRKGNCWDNVVAERFFKTMKAEWYTTTSMPPAQARLAVFENIESFYNRKRRYSALGYLTPCQYEDLLYSQVVAA